MLLRNTKFCTISEDMSSVFQPLLCSISYDFVAFLAELLATSLLILVRSGVRVVDY